MTIEAGVVIDTDGVPLFWHTPQDRTGGSLPDSVTLWDVFWTNRDKILGFAHSHPGGGVPGPSYEDVTTFAAVEAALGKRLDWWIASENRLVVARWKGPHRLTYEAELMDSNPTWLPKLRELSEYQHHTKKQEVQHGRSNYHPGQ